MSGGELLKVVRRRCERASRTASYETAEARGTSAERGGYGREMLHQWQIASRMCGWPAKDISTTPRPAATHPSSTARCAVWRRCTQVARSRQALTPAYRCELG